jgi:hypothetical protein
MIAEATASGGTLFSGRFPSYTHTKYTGEKKLKFICAAGRYGSPAAAAVTTEITKRARGSSRKFLIVFMMFVYIMLGAGNRIFIGEHTIGIPCASLA